MVGDRDGVVIVPLVQAEAVLAALDGVRKAEANLEAKVKAGLQIPEFVEAIMRSDRVIEVD